ncbi:MAG TPA: sulfatase [Terriglobales bacterium]|jgi:arylsulfatase A-like enzyme
MKRKSLLLVTVDCLRADHVGFLGYSRPTTPFLDSLSPGSFVFPSALVAGAPTYFSFPAIMAARCPLSLGRDVIGIAPQEPTLAAALRDAGYVTAAFLAANPYLSARCGYDQGFGTFHDCLDVGLPADDKRSSSRVTRLNQGLQSVATRTRWTRAAYNEMYFLYCQWRSSRKPVTMDQLRRYPAADFIVNQAVSWLHGLDDTPFFLWIHLMDPHHPYYPPEEALSAVGCPGITAGEASRLNASWNRGDLQPERLRPYRDAIFALYDASICWVDRQLSRLAEALQRADRWQDLVWVVTADHGEEFLEHGSRYHSPENLWKELTDVPLLLRVPGTQGARLPGLPFSLMDLAPTLLEIVEVPSPVSFEGKSRWQQIKSGTLSREPVLMECLQGCTNPFRMEDRLNSRLLAVRQGKYKLTLDFRQESVNLYDLEGDPDESTPLPADAARPQRRQLLEFARNHLQVHGVRLNQDLRLAAILRDLRHRLDGGHQPSLNERARTAAHSDTVSSDR